MRAEWLFLVGLCLVFSVSPCRAESIIVLPVYADARVPAGTTERILQTVTKHLEMQGHTVVQPITAAPLPSSSIEDCNAPACYLKYTNGEASLALVLTLFQDKQGTSAAVLLFQPPSHEYYEGIDLRESPEMELTAVLDRLLAAYEAGPGPWLEVTGSPDHAMVLLDGKIIGLLPFRGRTTRGEHILTVRAANHADTNLTVRLDSFANSVSSQEVDLVPLTHAQSEASSGAGSSSYRPWLAPLAIAAAGLGGATLTSVGIYRWTQRGECDDRECSKRLAWGTGSTALLGSGAALTLAAAIGGGFWWLRERRELRLHAGRRSAVLTLSAEF